MVRLEPSAVVAAARAVVDERGLEGLTMRGVASRLGCSVGTLYNQVGDREALAGAVVQQVSDELVAALTRYPMTDGAERIDAYLELMVSQGELALAVLTSRWPATLEPTRMLHRGALADRPALRVLAAQLPPGANGELDAQVAWACIYGLTVRCLVEDIAADRRAELAAGVARLLDRPPARREAENPTRDTHHSEAPAADLSIADAPRTPIPRRTP
jgi:AcrR family transcriptional regulator